MRFCLYFVLAICAFASGSSVLGQGGVQVSLTTSGVFFRAPSPEAHTLNSVNRGRGIAPVRNTFVATASLTNLSRAAIELNYPDEGAAARRFSFAILDSEGTELWNSESAAATPEAAAGASISIDFPRKATWRRTVRIPLTNSAGEWLPTGRYTLQAQLGNSPVSATTFFDVLNEPLAASTGIQGKVTTYDPIPSAVATRALATSAGLAIPAAATVVLGQSGGEVMITEIANPNILLDRPLFNATIPVTDGTYKVVTPPGRYQVVAHSSGLVVFPPAPSTPTIFEVVVTEGQFTTRNLGYLGPNPSTLSYRLVERAVEVSFQVIIPFVGPDFYLSVYATGTVTSAGWRYGRLVLRSADLTADGILEFNFQAAPPTEPAAQVLSNITGDFFSMRLPHGFKGVRVYSRTNAKTKLEPGL